MKPPSKHSAAHLFLFVSGVACLCLPTRWAQPAFLHCTYYLLLTLTIIFLSLSYHTLRNIISWKKQSRFLYSAILSTTVCTLFIALTVPPEARILSDETNLAAVSKSLAFDKQPLNTTMGRWHFNNFWPLAREVDKRPPLFSFLVSLIHSFTGFSYANLFYFNLFVFSLLLLCVYIIVGSLVSPGVGLAAQLFILSQPVIVLSARSSGYDLFQVTATVASLSVLYQLFRKPSPPLLVLFLYSLVFLFNIRQESSLVTGVLFLGLVFGLPRFWKFVVGYEWLYALSPFLMAPRVWHWLHYKADYEIYSPNIKAWSTSNLTENLRVFANGLMRLDLYLPFNGVVQVLGLLSFVGWICYILQTRKKFSEPHSKIILISLLIVGALNGTYLFYYFGFYNHPASARFFCLLSLATALATVLALSRLRFLSPMALIALGLAAIAIYHPVTMENRFYHTMTVPREYRFVMEKLKTAHGKRVWVITDRPGQYTVHDYGAFTHDWARANPEQLKQALKSHLVDEILVVQMTQVYSERPIPGQEMPGGFTLTPLHSSQIDSDKYSRISALGVEPLPARPEALVHRALSSIPP